eukprot:2111954-Rhodomonas_salina.2
MKGTFSCGDVKKDEADSSARFPPHVCANSRNVSRHTAMNHTDSLSGFTASSDTVWQHSSHSPHIG